MVLTENSEDLVNRSPDEPPENSSTIPPGVSGEQPSTSHSSLPSDGSMLVKTVTQLLNEDFLKKICNKAIVEMKKITGFDPEKNYTGTELDAMFTTTTLCLENYYTQGLNDMLQIFNQGFQNSSDFQSSSNSTSLNERTIEKLLESSETFTNGGLKIQNEPSAIDVDAIFHQIIYEDCSSRDSYSSDLNDDDDDDDDDVPNTSNKEQQNNASKKPKNAIADNIYIPDIEKELNLLKNKNKSEDSSSTDYDSEMNETCKMRLDKNSDEKDDSSNVKDGGKLCTSSNDDKNSLPTGHIDNETDYNIGPYEYSHEYNIEDLFETCVTETKNNSLLCESFEEESNIEEEVTHDDPLNESIEKEPQHSDNIKDDVGDDLISEDESDDFNPKKTSKRLDQIGKLVSANSKLFNSSDDDSETDVKKKKRSNSITNESNSSDDEENLSLCKKSKKSFVFNSDDEDNRNDNENMDDNSSDSSEKLVIKTKRPKRKRVVRMSDEENDDESSRSSRSCSDSANKSRKKIKKIISQDRVLKETKDAEKNERERRRRIEEKQKLYNQLIVQENKEQSEQVSQVVLDFDKETKQILVEVNKEFVKYLKPHQVDGIKFLFNCTIESVERLTKHNHSSGCILAHTMGLGKTFQVITFLHTIMTSPFIKDIIKCVLIVVPLNVIENWANEFDKWFEECGLEQEICVYKGFYNDKTANARKDTLNTWKENGGILLCTNTIFNNCLKIRKKSVISTIKECLLDPGPDMVIIDEGHLLKNDQGIFNKNLSQIKTLRRIILTGTPLQNNLSEYYTMVSFVKPNLLGSKKEFKNRFENPIKNGQHCDSTEFDVHMMKKRVHILYKLLKDCIHRCDYSVLVPYLQPKYEYVLSLRLTELQEKLYKYYLENLAKKGEPFQHLFADFTRLSYIWNHPALLERYYQRKEIAEDQEKDKEDSLDGFIVNDSASESMTESDQSDTLIKKEEDVSLKSKEESPEVDSDIELVYEKQCKKKTTSVNLHTPELGVKSETIDDSKWIEKFMPENLLDLNLSAKFILLFTILEKCETIGDKILIFSQSLTTLDLIEEFLQIKMEEYFEKYGPIDDDQSYEEVVAKTGGVSHCWKRDEDYFRIDGNVQCNTRTQILKHFNNPEKHRARLLLISTKAGGIGINLVGANRCIIFDASWNPANDMQAIFRIFRYGQLKPVYVYRFTASGTMESKIYERQILKQSLSHRVIDEQQIQRHFKANEANELYQYHGADECRKVPEVPKDNLLADVYQTNKDLILNCHEHDSLLENRPEEGLTEEERRTAWAEYEHEKERGFFPEQNLAFLNNFTSSQRDSQVNTQPHNQFIGHQQQLGQQSNPFFASFRASTSTQSHQAPFSQMPSPTLNLQLAYQQHIQRLARQQQHFLQQQNEHQLQRQQHQYQNQPQPTYQNPHQYQNHQHRPQIRRSNFNSKEECITISDDDEPK